MRISVPIVIEIDPATWAEQEGLCDSNGRYTLAMVRADVRAHVTTMIQGSELIAMAGGVVNP